MSFDAGAVIGRLEMNITGWQKSVETVKKDQTSLSGFALRHEKAIESLGKKLTVTGGLIVASLGAMIKKTADAGDRINDLSQRTGIATEILSGYKLAADKSGTSLEGFATGMKGLSRVMVEAASGGKEAQDAFKDIGVSATDSAGKVRPLDQVMLDVADRFAGMADGAEKNALAMKLFGKSGMDLIPMLNMGRKGLEDNYEATKKLHGIWSGPAAKAADQFNDSIAEMKMSMGGLSKEIGMMFLPTAKKLVDGLTNIVSKFGEWAAEHPGIIASTGKMVFGLAALAAQMGPILIALPRLVEGFRILKSTEFGSNLIGQFKGLGQNVSSVSMVLGKLPLIATAAFVGWQIGRVIGEVTGLDKGIENVAGKVINLLGLYKGLDVEWLAGHTAAEAKRQEALALASEITGKKITDIHKALAILKEQYLETGTTGSQTLDEWVKKSLAAGTATKGLIGPVDELTKLFSKFGLQTRTELTKELADAEAALKMLKGSAEATPGAITALEEKIRTLKDGMTGLKTETRTLAEQLGISFRSEAEERVKKLNQALLEYRGKLTADQIIKIYEELRTLDATMKGMVPNAETLGQTIDKALSGLDDTAGDTAKAIAEAFQDDAWDAIKTDAEKLMVADLPGWLQNIPEASKKAGQETASTWDQTTKEITNIWEAGLLDMFKGTKTFGDLIQNTFSVLAGYVGQKVSKLVSKTLESLGAFAGPLGAIAGAVAGSLVSLVGNLFKKIPAITADQLKTLTDIVGKTKAQIYVHLNTEEAEKEIARLQREMAAMVNEMGAQLSNLGEVSSATLEAIAKDREKGMAGYVAENKHLAEIIKDVGVNQTNINALWQKTLDIIDEVKSGVMSAADATKALGDSFTAMVEGARKLGAEGGQGMVDFIKKLRAAGVEVPEVTAYVIGELNKIPSALNTLISNISIKSPRAANDLASMGRIAVQSFGAMLANGVNFIDALNAMSGPLQAMLDKYKEAKLAIPSFLLPLLHIQNLAKKFPETFQNMSAGLQILNSLRNSAYLTQDTFNALITTVEDFAHAILGTAGNLNTFLQSAKLNQTQIQALLPVVSQFVGAAAIFGLTVPSWMKTFVTKNLGVDWEKFKTAAAAQASSGIATVQKLTDMITQADKLHGDLKTHNEKMKDAMLKRHDFLFGLLADRVKEGLTNLGDRLLGGSAGTPGTPSPNVPGLQKGGIVWQEQLIRAGEVPEVIAPLSDLGRILNTAIPRNGGARTKILNFTANFTIKALDSKDVRDVVKTDIAPALVEVIRTNFHELGTKLKEAQGIA